MNLLNVVLGLILVLLGRPLYWAFVAIAGFLLGMQLAGELLVDQPQWMQILAAILTGIVGALLALVAVRLAFALAGFFAGGYLAAMGATALDVTGNAYLIALVVGAVAGAVIAAIVMDWAIILLSSLIGASLTAAGMNLEPLWSAAAFVALVLVGVVVQGGALSRSHPKPPMEQKSVRA